MAKSFSQQYKTVSNSSYPRALMECYPGNATGRRSVRDVEPLYGHQSEREYNENSSYGTRKRFELIQSEAMEVCYNEKRLSLIEERVRLISSIWYFLLPGHRRRVHQINAELAEMNLGGIGEEFRRRRRKEVYSLLAQSDELYTRTEGLLERLNGNHSSEVQSKDL